jgi:hypothetical protein
MIDINKFTDKLVKYKISPNQLYFCSCLMENDKFNLTRVWNLGVKISSDEIQDLIKRKIINIINESKPISINNLFINPSFREGLEFDIEVLAEELRQCYFKRLDVNGTIYPARNIDDFDLRKLYSEILKGDIELHKKIINVTKKYVDGKEVGNLGLDKYIKSKFWESLEESKDTTVIGSKIIT